MRSIKEQDLITNEYLEVVVNRKIYRFCVNCYNALGWRVISIKAGITSVKIILERKRQINNKNELCKLQRECEDIFVKMETMLSEKKYIMRKMNVKKLVGAAGNKMWNSMELNVYYDVIYSLCERAQKLN